LRIRTAIIDRNAADKVLADKALGRVTAKDSALSERAAAAAVWAAMKETKIDMGMKSKKMIRKKSMKKRILLTAKQGNALPFLPMLGSGSLIGGAVNDNKAARHQFEQLQCHDRAMEQSRGQIRTRTLSQPLPTRIGHNSKENKNAKETIKMPSDVITDVLERARETYAYYTLEAFSCSNTLLTSGACRNENGNLDDGA